MNKLPLDRYQVLLGELDSWFARCMTVAPEQIACRTGCSGCCRGLFEISLLDAALLQRAFARLPAAEQAPVLVKARARVDQLQLAWPELVSPYILNRLPHNDWEEMPEEDSTPCPLLGADGRCLVYAARPMTCRLHGLPNIDVSGESFSDEWCTLNFTGANPLQMPELRHPFAATFAREFDLLAETATVIFGEPQLELDTFIPCALLVDYSQPLALRK